MTFNASGLFRQTLNDLFLNTILSATFNLDSETAWLNALYDNSITPSKDDTAQLCSYTGTSSIYTAAGGATGGPQVFQAGQWAVGGVTLTTTALTVVAGGIVQWTAANSASGAACTMSNIYGSYIYNNALTPKYGLGFVAFTAAPPYSVTAGTLTIQWNANGIFRWSL
jgi:hypothetical protein